MFESYPWPVWLALKIDGSDNAGVDDYLGHSDARVISAFFLGFVFMSGTHYATSSTFIRDVFYKLRASLAAPFVRERNRDVEAPFVLSEKRGLIGQQETRSLEQFNDHSALVFTLNLSLILASLAMVLSILTFTSNSGSETICAFLIAWAGMAAQLTRLIGFIIVIMGMKQMNLRKWEPWLLWGLMLVALAFIFAFNATNTGTTSNPMSTGLVSCYRKHFLPTAIASSITNFVIEFCLLIRLFMYHVPRRARVRDRLVSLKVLSVARVSALIVFDALTVVPDAISTNIFAQFIPFGLGALIILAVFNRKAAFVQSPLPSLVINSRQRELDLLDPSPFTLQYPSGGIQHAEDEAQHSWCSHSLHRPPSNASLSEQSSAQVDSSIEEISTRTVENVVITRASAAWRRSVKKILLPPPSKSAPAEIPYFAPQTSPPGKILQSQVGVAAQLEEDDKKSQLAGPSTGLKFPHKARPPDVSIETRDEAESLVGYGAVTPASAVFGSDIIRTAPSGRRADRPSLRYSSYTQSSYMLSPVSRQSRSTRHHSFASSRVTERTSDESLKDARPAASPRTSRNRSFWFTRNSESYPLRTTNRFSFASVRSRARDDLSAVRERTLEGGSPPRSRSRKSSRSRRATFGLVSMSSTKRSKRDTVGSFFIPTEPMPMPMPVPPGPVHLRQPSPAPNLATQGLPVLHLLPATLNTAVVGLPSSPRAWIQRPVKVKGPRPLPSALLQGVDWPMLEDPLSTLPGEGSWRNSYPSPHSSSSHETVISSKRPSV